jgi:hypothetical protein
MSRGYIFSPFGACLAVAGLLGVTLLCGGTAIEVTLQVPVTLIQSLLTRVQMFPLR